MLSFFGRKSPDKLFLSLVISEGTVAAALWKVSGGQQSMVAHSSPKPWEVEVESSLIDSSDAALNDLGNEVNSVKEILLGLPDTWATGTTIASNKKALLHKLAKQLNLKSVGFVIVPEAITAHFRDQEKTGLNALLVYVSEKTVFLMPIVHGQAGEPSKVGKSESLIQDVVEAAARGNLTNLPGRIILASQDLTDAQLVSSQQQLQSTQWKEGLFLHHPRVDSVPPQMILDCVSLAGGREVAKAMGIMGKEAVPAAEEMPEESEAGFGFKPVVEEAGAPLAVAAEEEELVPDGKVEMEIGEKPKRKALPKLGIIPIVIGLILLGLGALFYFGTNSLARAQVDVTVKAKPVSFDTALTIDANASESNPDANILKATQRTKQIEDTAEAVSTGTKTIGDKAKGAVTIYNRTTVGDKQFKAGTVLKLDANVQFTTDSDITIPVGTQDSGFVGKATVNATAINIGAESNIAANTMLTVDSYDKTSFYATTNADFTGGSSRNVQVVSETDQKKLADSLYVTLKQKAQTAFNSEVSPGEYVALSDNVPVTKKVFSDDIGKEVKSFTLTMGVTVSAVVYTNQDIVAYASAKLASQIPQGSTLKPERTTIEIKDQQTISDTKTQVNARISSLVTPAFDAEALKASLAGKPLPDAFNTLATSPDFSSYHVSFSPSWAQQLLRTFPPAGRIKVSSSFE